MKKVFICIALILVLASLIVSGCTPSGSTEVVKVGLLYPTTGPMAMTGARMVEANTLAFERVNYKAAGKTIEVIVGDSGSQPAMAIDTARRMVENDKVAIILGPIMGNVKLAVAEYMSKVGVPHLNTSPSPWPILVAGMDWSFAGGGAEQQFSSSAGNYAYDAGFRKVTAMTEDLFHAHGFIESYTNAFESRGGEVIQQQFTPYPSTDFSPYLTALKDADALTAWYEGSDAILFFNQVHDFGVRKRMPVTAAFFGSFYANFILHELPAEAAAACIGELTATPYSPLLEHKENQEFVKFFKDKYGYLPDDTDTTPYDGGQIFIKALEATKGDTDPEKLRDAILSVDFMGVQGRVIFSKASQCRIRNVYVCEVVEQDGKFLWVPVHTYEDVRPFGFAAPPAPPPDA